MFDYENHVLAGLQERFATVVGLPQYDAAGQVVNFLDYEPGTVQTQPLLYTLLERVEFPQLGGVKAAKYYSLHRICWPWADRAGAERMVRAFCTALQVAVAFDSHLGGRLNGGFAEISDVDAGWDTIGGTECRVLEYHSVALEK